MSTTTLRPSSPVEVTFLTQIRDCHSQDGVYKKSFLSLDRTSPFGMKMPAPKRKPNTKKEDKDLQRAAPRAWMIDQKRNLSEAEEGVVVEEAKDEDGRF